MFWGRKTLSPEQSLINALAASDLDEARRLLAAGADANARDRGGMPALAIVASAKWLEAVQILLQHGANPNTVVDAPARGLNRGPVLNLAAANGSLVVLNALLAAGARVDASDATGLTALMSAAFMGHAPLVESLVAHHARLEQSDERGYTALMFACNAGCSAVVRALLAAGANPHATDTQGSTPIMFAAQHAHDEIVGVLLDVGADPNVKGRHGMSAIGLAVQNGHDSTLRVLGAAGT